MKNSFLIIGLMATAQFAFAQEYCAARPGQVGQVSISCRARGTDSNGVKSHIDLSTTLKFKADANDCKTMEFKPGRATSVVTKYPAGNVILKNPSVNWSMNILDERFDEGSTLTLVLSEGRSGFHKVRITANHTTLLGTTSGSVLDQNADIVIEEYGPDARYKGLRSGRCSVYVPFVQL